MPTPVFILGGWQSDFAQKAPGGDVYPLIESATFGTLDDAGIVPADVEVVHVGNFAGELFNFQGQMGGLVAAAHRDLAGKPASRHEAACASGSMAVLAAMSDLESGRYGTALVLGAEVLRNVPGAEAGVRLGCAAWTGREVVDEPFPWPSMFDRMAVEYERRYGLDHRHLGRIAEINVGNARRNGNAQTRSWEIPEGSYHADDEVNPRVGAILRKQDCSRTTDGSAGVVLASGKVAGEWARARGIALESVPRIQGWGHRTGTMLLEDKLAAGARAEYVFPHLRTAIVDSFRRAGISSPYELDAIETHDCFSISEYIALDHFGITSPGKAWQAVEDGTIEPGGRLPVNPSGGLLGLGHPVGATGVRMLLDGAKQVGGRAGDYQVPGARRVGLLNLGGSATTVATFVVGV
ncbi:acetyl-CoA acetyltransferase [Actinomadura madurae]|uniref:acetyl-CoA acetyltransferase n=1 Tax=Actinomadura madurae TaxID=1993 RepID=UPI0020263287|nr:acetyl-CoA acetyltransferase [Actinomadura madurae]MCP9972220.1 acetyl-CoA acetyltransferase [Actinomadura madurae]URN00931.1 acetyl-CoA acetyltransferase [Actinomadura madurae]URN03082.1 acetyl-CoA acetyltransferase [Actinomadura madurae]